MVKTKYRNIQTAIPAPETEALLAEMRLHDAEDMATHELPVVWDSAKDFQVFDKHGNTWIDFSSGIFVANVGHAAPRVVAAVKTMAEKSLLHSYVFLNESRLQLTRKLTKITGLDRVLLTVTGSEANDAAIQMMRKNRPGKILSIKGAYYGSTTACRALAEHTIDESVLPGAFNPEEVSGVFLQAFRGRDANFLPYEWITAWVKWAQKNNIPVGFDEMQSGFARTGKWFGHQHFDITPDFITVGKALGGGLPISAVIGKKELLQDKDLWSTHTGNPVCCAAAVATLETIEQEKLVEKTAGRDQMVQDLLKKLFPDRNTFGRGMIWAIYTGDPVLTQKVITRCAEKGVLLVSTHGMAIKIGPPLTIPDEALVEGLEVIKEVFEEIHG